MRKGVFIGLLLLTGSFAFAQNENKIITATRVTEAPKVDGKLDDQVWLTAQPIEGFIVTAPKYGTTPANRTQVYIAYTNEAVYIAAKLFIDQKNIRKQLTKRDGELRKDVDYFSVFFDTYRDKQNGFQFLVTSQNVQTDGRISLGADVDFGQLSDYTWDAVWESNTTITATGWNVEMRIPYSALRFAKKDIQDWGINFYRFNRLDNEASYWAPINPNISGFANQFGILKGLEKLDPPVRLSFLPYISTGFNTTPTANGRVNQVLRNGGLDVKYGVNESFTLDMTLIPDFGQVVSDNVINNLTPFEVQFTENRPFFTEGTEIFNKAGLFYSRRIGSTPQGYDAVQSMQSDSLSIIKNPYTSQLYNATKFSGRTRKKLGIGIFNAVVAPSYATLQNNRTKEKTKWNTDVLSNYNVLVLDQALKGQSSITFTNTNVMRNGAGRDANVSALNTFLYDKSNTYRFAGGYYHSRILDAVKKNGYSANASIAKVSGKVQYELEHVVISDTYDPNDLGFQRAPNIRNYNFNVGYYQQTATPRFNMYNYSLGVNLKRYYKPNVFRQLEIEANAFYLFKNFYDLTIVAGASPYWTNDYFEMRTPGVFLKRVSYGFIGMNGSSDSRKRYYAALRLFFAESPHITNDYYYDFYTSHRYRFNDKFQATIEHGRTHDHGQYGYAFIREPDGSPILGRRKTKDFYTTLNGTYNFNSRMYITCRARHYWSQIEYVGFYNMKSDGYWKDRAFIAGQDQNYNLWNLDAFYTWDFRYGSKIILGWKNWLGSDFLVDGNRYKNYGANYYQSLRNPHGNEVTARFIYYLDYQTLKNKHKKAL